MKNAVHYFVAIGDDLQPRVVGTSQSANGPRALVLFADKRYGQSVWDWRICRESGRKYIVARATGECLSANPFPEWM